MPLQLQSKDATQTLPACPFHSQSVGVHSYNQEKVGGKHVKETLFNTLQRNRPGGVPQHMFLSSMWLTSKPMNHDPSDTSSFAYLCRIGLRNITCIISFPLDEQTPFCMSWTLIKHTDWLKYKSQDLSKRHISALSHDGSIYFLPPQISSTQVHGTSHSYMNRAGSSRPLLVL